MTAHDTSDYRDDIIHKLLITLQLFSVSYNLFIYISCNTKFKTTLLKLICPCCLKRRSRVGVTQLQLPRTSVMTISPGASKGTSPAQCYVTQDLTTDAG